MDMSGDSTGDNPRLSIALAAADIMAREYMSLREEALETFRRTSQMAFGAIAVGGTLLSINRATNPLPTNDLAVLIAIGAAFVAATSLMYIGQLNGVFDVNDYCMELGRELRSLLESVAPSSMPLPASLLAWEERVRDKPKGRLTESAILQVGTSLELVLIWAASAVLTIWAALLSLGASDARPVLPVIIAVDVVLLATSAASGWRTVRRLRHR
jgi:hypothetical protein